MKLRTLLFGAAASVALAPMAYAGSHEAQGRDGHLNIIYWQAASIINPYLSGGSKDRDASAIVIEPLVRYDENGAMVPYLVDTIPTLANGGISEDLTSITWKLSEGILWSDGTALTAADVVFTAGYCMAEDGGCASATNFADVESVEAIDDLTVKITFSKPKPFPYGPFVGNASPILQAAQFANCVGAAAPNCTAENFGPIGTGPFMVAEFRANDTISYIANPNYRDPSKPAFASITFKGGGDAAAAARAVLETGEFDYAWNMQVDPAVLANMEAAGKGRVVSSFGTMVERILVNLTDSTAGAGDARSTLDAGGHPYLSDPAVRRALSMAIDRATLVDVGYGAAGKVTCNVVPAPAIYASTANDWCLTQDIAGANALLDAAGWVDSNGDGIRDKDGVELSILYQTSTNAVRQDTQALIKQWWGQIGVETELRSVDAAVFFGSDPASPDTYQKFFADIEMYTNWFDGTDPETYMNSWTCAEIPGPGNGWQGNNMPRYCNPEYDALVAVLSGTSALDERAAIIQKLNDMLMETGAIIPLIHRGSVSAHANTLHGVRLNAWDSEMWNIADWTRGDM